MKPTKIVATIGPRTAKAEIIREMTEAGMDVARLNGAHADDEWHGRTIELLREVAPQVPIILDLPGGKVRAEHLQHEPSFDVGDHITFTISGRQGPSLVPVTGAVRPEDLSIGDVLQGDDGSLTFTVIEILETDVVCRADTAGTLRSRKGISLPSSERYGAITDRDLQLIDLARRHAVDFIGLSFVSSGEHVEAIRAEIGAEVPRIVAKIESQPGLDHLQAIAEAADALLVDRGDLSVETSLESLVIWQKKILRVGRHAGKPVIIATEMLHSMIENPVPTKAEVCDIGNAVLDGASAIMLSGETAIGKYPVRALSLMKSIASAAAEFEQAGHDERHARYVGIPVAMGDAISLICRQLPITKIVAVTINGYAARTVAVSRPRQPLLAVTNNAAAARSFNLLPGTEGVFVDIEYDRRSTDHIANCLEVLWRRGKVSDDDLVLVASLGYPKSGNRMNMIQTHRIADLREALEWRKDKRTASLEAAARQSVAG